MEINNLPDKELKVMIIKLLTKLRRRLNEHSENSNNKTENTIRYQVKARELRKIITELKNTLEGFSIRLDKAEDRINELEARIVELTQTDQQKEKRTKNCEDS